MQKTLNVEAVRAALTSKGWDQKQLARVLDVSGQAVTNWLKGKDFPRPPTLLKLAGALRLGFDQLVQSNDATKPIIAFRKKGNAKTTQAHIARAVSMGMLLKPLVDKLPERQSLRTQIPDPSRDYERLQATAAAVRAKLGIGQAAELTYEHLISQFAENDAIIVPVMWESKKTHENALHILLPESKVTFVYLNLDTHLEDFKFWMAHELAHVYTPELAGEEEGEDFADAFAGALLFPRELAQQAYNGAVSARSVAGVKAVLLDFAREHRISVYSVFNEVSKYAKSQDLAPLALSAQEVHKFRNSGLVKGKLVSESLFAPMPPDAAQYIAVAHSVFQSSFFNALRAFLRECGTGPGYVQQILNLSLRDATAIHHELLR